MIRCKARHLDQARSLRPLELVKLPGRRAGARLELLASVSNMTNRRPVPGVIRCKARHRHDLDQVRSPERWSW